MKSKKEVVAIYSGEVYHDINGVTYKHFVVEERGAEADGRLVTLPTKIFPIDLKVGDICSIVLIRKGR